jgi:hypothetical protein
VRTAFASLFATVIFLGCSSTDGTSQASTNCTIEGTYTLSSSIEQQSAACNLTASGNPDTVIIAKKQGNQYAIDPTTFASDEASIACIGTADGCSLNGSCIYTRKTTGEQLDITHTFIWRFEPTGFTGGSHLVAKFQTGDVCDVTYNDSGSPH